MGIHSTLKSFVCLAVVLAASAVGTAHAGGGFKGRAVAGTAMVVPKVQGATANLSGASGLYFRPKYPGRPRPTGGSGAGCTKGGCPK
jgi:hypothetical protein